MKPHKMKRCVPVLLFVCFLIPMLMLPGCTFNTDCQKDAAEHLSQILVTTYTTQVPDSAAVLTDYQDVLSHPDDTALCAAAQATLNAQVTGDVQCASLITNAGDVLLSTDPGRSGTSVVDSYVNKRMKGAHLDVFAELAFDSRHDRRTPGVGSRKCFLWFSGANPDLAGFFQTGSGARRTGPSRYSDRYP